MRILIYHGKHGDDYYLVDTPERLEAALQRLFQQLDDWGCYDEGARCGRNWRHLNCASTD